MFWCYECNMSVMVFLTGSPLSCPNCLGGFLEEMEPRVPRNDDHAAGDAIDGIIEDSVDLDDLFFPSIDGSRQRFDDFHDIFDRLINRIVSSSSDDYDAVGNGPLPTSTRFVEAIPEIKITEDFLSADRFIMCAVCKDEFVVNTEAKQLPCNHIYHPDCILPWLSKNNSCPVCRFSLPTEDQEEKMLAGRNQDRETEAERHARVVHNLLSSFFPGNDDALAEAESDLLDIGSMLRRVRRRRLSLMRRSRRFYAATASSSARLSRSELDSESRSSGGWNMDEESGASGSGTVDTDLGLEHFRF